MSQPDTNIVSAARRVANAIRNDERGIGGTPQPDDLRTLLPLLDAVAAGPGGDRVERWALAIARCGRSTAATGQAFVDVRDAACAAIALADAERAMAVAEGWAAYEEARDRAFVDAGAIYDDERPKARLDAAVRALAGG